MAKTKSGYGAGRKNYMALLLAERLSGEVAATFQSQAMQHGTDTEQEARDAYQFFTGREVQEIAFVDHPTIKMAGCSPDGLVEEIGLIEIKCPNTATHLEYLETEKIPSNYRKQMQWQMDCTGREWCDFISYDPRVPEQIRTFIKRFYSDAELSAEIEDEVRTFLSELDSRVNALQTKHFKQEAAE